MKLSRRRFLRVAASAAALATASHRVQAQVYPSRPVRFVVPSVPGGTPDILARLIAQWLSMRLGQPFVVENRPGAGTNIGTEAVVRAPADGYTLLLVSPAHAINATLYDKLNFNFIRDIAPAASGNSGDQPMAAEDESTITHVFGVAQNPPRPELVPVAAASGTDNSVAALLPELKRLVQERLHHSSLRLEILLEDAAANNASLDAVVAEVRATPIRGVMQSTLDDLADEMLALGRR